MATGIKRVFTVITILMLTGCASQQLAQQHWSWLTAGNTTGGAGYSTGVNVQNITVNSQTYRVITPVR